jgi:hypothetical protein
MRRTPAVALVGLLLGLSGCAGVPQRLGWSSPAMDRSDPAETPSASRLTWWRWPRAENSTADQAAKITEARETTQPAASTKLPTDVWPESRSEWLARRFPLLSRRLNGPTVSAAVDGDAGLRELNGRLLAPWSTAAVASSGRADDDVRPVDATATSDDATSERQAVQAQVGQRMPPLFATPSVVKSRPHSLPETSGDVALDITQAEPRQTGQAPSNDAEMASTEPGPASSSAIDSASVVAMSDVDRPSSEPPANSQADAALEQVTGQSAAPELETSLVQAPGPPAADTQPPSSIPPPPPPVRQTPPPAPPIDRDTPAANPTQPEVSTPPAPDAAKPKEAEETPPQSAPAPSTPETPPPPQTPVSLVPTTLAPVSTPAAAPAPRFNQPLVSVAQRSPYASPPPMAPPPPRHKFLGLFFVEETPRPLATPQLPPAMFPASYHVQTPRPAQVLPASQAVAATPPVACNAPQKPCVLSVLLQKIKSCAKRSGCSGCHHGASAPCCQGCTCYNGTGKTAQGSPRGNLASPQAKPALCPGHPTSPAALLGSNGTNPGDVTEEGKLFERVSFESFDKTIER